MEEVRDEDVEGCEAWVRRMQWPGAPVRMIICELVLREGRTQGGTRVVRELMCCSSSLG